MPADGDQSSAAATPAKANAETASAAKGARMRRVIGHASKSIGGHPADRRTPPMRSSSAPDRSGESRSEFYGGRLSRVVSGPRPVDAPQHRSPTRKAGTQSVRRTGEPQRFASSSRICVRSTTSWVGGAGGGRFLGRLPGQHVDPLDRNEQRNGDDGEVDHDSDEVAVGEHAALFSRVSQVGRGHGARQRNKIVGEVRVARRCR